MKYMFSNNNLVPILLFDSLNNNKFLINCLFVSEKNRIYSELIFRQF